MKDEILTLDELIAVFFKNDFSFEQAEEILGPRQEEEEDAFVLQPKRPNVAMARLEKVIIKPGNPPLLVGIRVEYEKPVRVDFKDLSKRYGDKLKVLGPGPEDPEEDDDTIMYRWMIKSDDFLGYLVLETPDFSEAAIRPVIMMVLRRFPPKLWKFAEVIEMCIPPHMVMAALPEGWDAPK